MEWINAFLALSVGLFLRLAFPLAVTILVVALLRHLDARWQTEAAQTPVVPDTKCWQIKNCPPEQRENCAAANSNQPCWQERRLTNGYLREECLSCEVFEQAPVPVRM
jgi:hypothetical protein